MKEGDSQVLVCALATLDRWIALGEQLMVGFCIVGKARSARKFWRDIRKYDCLSEAVLGEFRFPVLSCIIVPTLSTTPL